MKKILSLATTLIFCVLLAGSVYAKDIRMEIEWDFDVDFEQDVVEFVIYYQNQLQPNVFVEVMRINNPAVRIAQTPTFNLAPGKTSDFFVSAVYDTGEEEYSIEGYPYKFTGKPVVRRADKTQ